MQPWLVDRWWAWVVPLSWQLAIWVAIVAAAVWLARKASPQVRYLLWTLVLVKVFLPPSLAVNWGVGHWAIEPVRQSFNLPAIAPEGEAPDAPAGVESPSMESPPDQSAQADVRSSSRTWLFVIWLCGVASVSGIAVLQYRRLQRQTRSMQRIDEGPLRVALERAALQARVKQVPDLFVSHDTASPFMFGLMRPCIVLPQVLVDKLSPPELDGVLLHELNHHRRGDLWIGLLQAIVQSLLWFHPLVWWANARLRHERECACDQDVLRQIDSSPADYGQTLLNVLSVARGRALYQANLVGVYEPGANVQQRLEEIMKDQPGTRAPALWYLAMASLLVVFLPMASVNSATDQPTSTDQPTATVEQASAPAMPAWVAETSPAIGATDVDPNISEITITFDRDMSKGMSWTGGGEEFPSVPEGAQAQWRDDRTCVLPVKLEKGQFYRVGINSTSHRNFRSAEGDPAPCTAIYFATEGASRAVAARVRVPKIVKMVPENGATDVDPKVKALRVTFDVPMGEGMSWTGGGEHFPEMPVGEQAKWTGGGKTCVLPVTLQPGHEYQLGINSPSHINFQSKWGVPVAPVRYQFKTR